MNFLWTRSLISQRRGLSYQSLFTTPKLSHRSLEWIGRYLSHPPLPDKISGYHLQKTSEKFLALPYKENNPEYSLHLQYVVLTHLALLNTKEIDREIEDPPASTP